MINRLAALRKARGISAVDLAGQVGITRQAIYAIEAGTYMPNTAVALRLARVLETAVEELFALEPDETTGGEQVAFEPLDDTSSFDAGAPVQICRVGKRVVGVAPAGSLCGCRIADGVVGADGHAALAGSPRIRTGC